MKKTILTLILCMALLMTSVAGLSVQADPVMPPGARRELSHLTGNGSDLSFSASNTEWWYNTMTFTDHAEPSYMYYFTDSAGIFNVAEVDGAGKLRIHTYNSNFERTSLRTFSFSSYPLWGGFYKGSDGYYYLAIGRTNPEQNDNKVVVQVRKYSQSWSLLGTAEIKGGASHAFKGIVEPFRAGCCSMALMDNKLVVHMSRLMYTQPDGLRHQSNITFEISTSDFSVKEMASYGSGRYVYSSHSFNQFVLRDGSDLIYADHGDAYPRSLLLSKTANYTGGNRTVSSRQVFDFMGATGDNYTGTSISSLEAGTTGYLLTGNSVPHNKPVFGATGNGPGFLRNIYLISVNKSTLAPSFQWVTNYLPQSTAVKPFEPKLIKLSSDRFALLYMLVKNGTPYTEYQLINSNGMTLAVKTFIGMTFNGLTDPIVTNNQIQWVDFVRDPSTYKRTYYSYVMNIADTYNPTMAAPIIPLQSIALSPSSKTLSLGGSVNLSIVYTPSNTSPKPSMTWKSSNTTIATVSSTGTVTAKKAGKATITATASSGEYATCAITVS